VSNTRLIFMHPFMKKVAESKKRTNVGEYIIYMYQIEDLIRAYNFDAGEIRKYVISHYPITEEEKSEVAAWFDALVVQMGEEGIREQGHLSGVQKEVDKLAQIHWDLLKNDGEYFKLYNRAKPHILEYISAADGKSLGHEIQICLNGIYGLLLCKLSGKKVPDELHQSAEAFGAVLGYLNEAYQESQGAG